MKEVFTFDEASHIYRFDGIPIPSITQTLGETGFVNTEYFTEEGRLRGTYVHDACWFYDTNAFEWGRVDERLHGYVRAWIKFKKEADFEPRIIEEKFYSETYRLAGRPDRGGRLGKEQNAIIEIKTGHPGMWCALQTAAQKVLIEEKYKGYWHRFAVELMEDGHYKLNIYNDPKDRNVFLSALTVCHWRRQNGIKYGE